MPVDLIQRGLVEAAYKVEAENEQYPTFEVTKAGHATDDSSDYFRVWIWKPTKDGAVADGIADGEETRLTLPLDSSFRFDLQFGRRVLAKLLGLEKRFNWRDCDQTQDEETADAEAFKDAFKAYDFALEE